MDSKEIFTVVCTQGSDRLVAFSNYLHGTGILITLLNLGLLTIFSNTSVHGAEPIGTYPTCAFQGTNASATICTCAYPVVFMITVLFLSRRCIKNLPLGINDARPSPVKIAPDMIFQFLKIPMFLISGLACV